MVDAEQADDYVRRLHQLVDQLVAPIVAVNAPRLACRVGCAGCCTDGLTVAGVEAERIRRDFGHVLEEAPAAEGCAFLDEAGACRVYAARPYVCRTQGLPLRWAEAGVEHRDICPLNEAGPPIEGLPVEACWTIGPVEARLLAVSTGERVALRSLFIRR